MDNQMTHEETEATTKRQDHLKSRGPIISVGLARPGSSLMPQDTIEATAIIDTGGHLVYIKTGLPERLGLSPIRSMNVLRSAPPPLEATVYRVTLVFSGGFFIELDAVELPLTYGGYDCIIGRSLLEHARFTYDGVNDTFSLTF